MLKVGLPPKDCKRSDTLNAKWLFQGPQEIFTRYYAKPNVAICNIAILLQFDPYSFNLISIFIQFNPCSFNSIPIVIQFNSYSHSIQSLFDSWTNRTPINKIK